MDKILVVRYGTIGDSIFASAFYRELRRNLKNSTIDILSDSVSTGVMKNCPYVDNIIKINGDNKYKHIKKYVEIFKNYDTVYFLKNDKFFTTVAYFAGVKNRIGFDIRRNKFLTIKSTYNEDRHEVDCYLDLLRVSGLAVENDKTEVWIDSESEKNIQKYIDTDKKKILIQAYSRFLQKNWIDKYWIEVIRYLSDKLDMQVYYSGGGKDKASYKKLSAELGELKNPPIDMSGKISIPETMALVKNMDFVIGIDSCSVHMSAALNIPTILIHGATSLKRWRPRSKNCTVLSKFFHCSPCCLQSGRRKYCKNKVSKCMLALSAEEVIKVLNEKYYAIANPEPKVTIIMPVCNSERYIARSVDSILNQTFNELELICIDTGSSDESVSILNEYIMRDKRVKLITSSGITRAQARNLGIKNASGTYISFLEVGDRVAPDFLEKLYNAAAKNEADISACGIIRCKKTSKSTILLYQKSSITSNYNKKIELSDIPAQCYVGNKLYKKEFLNRVNLYFEPIKNYEDVLFTPMALYYSDKYVTVPDTNYYFYKKTFSDNKEYSIADYSYVCEKLKNFFENKNINISALETKEVVYRVLGIPILRLIKKRNLKKYILLGVVKWEKDK